jgi:hypothetical protein
MSRAARAFGASALALLAVLVAVVGFALVPSTPADAEPLLTVTPNIDLRGGDKIQVNVTGMPPNTTLAIGVCQVGRAASGPGDCADTLTGASTLAMSDSGGNASTVLTVIEGPANNSVPPTYRCGPDSPCEVRASTIGDANEQVARQQLVYRGAASVSTVAQTSVDTAGTVDTGAGESAVPAKQAKKQARQQAAALSETGPRDVLVMSLVGVVLLQIGLMLSVRAVRSRPSRKA